MDMDAIRSACEGLTGRRVHRIVVLPVQSRMDSYLVRATFADDSKEVTYLLPGYEGQKVGWIQANLRRMDHLCWEGASGCSEPFLLFAS